mgnify:CR=1 FL=1
MNDDEKRARIVADFFEEPSGISRRKCVQWLTVPGHEGPFIQLLPQRDNLDGFFIARMKKEGGHE